jgi:hypothetical protein
VRGIAVGWRNLVQPLVRVVPVVPSHPRGPGLVQPLESRGVRVFERVVLLDAPERVLELALGPDPPTVERLDLDAPDPGLVLRLGVEPVRPALRAAIGEKLGRKTSALKRLVEHHDRVDLALVEEPTLDEGPAMVVFHQDEEEAAEERKAGFALDVVLPERIRLRHLESADRLNGRQTRPLQVGLDADVATVSGNTANSR